MNYLKKYNKIGDIMIAWKYFSLKIYTQKY